MKSSLDKTLLQFYDKHWRRKLYPAGQELGIEIECEGMGFEPGRWKYWNSVAEGSLRGGIEYVLTQPISIKRLPLALNEFSSITANVRFVDSIRTSTHMHINMLHRTLRQIYSFLTAYILVENVLVAMNGTNREGNLFCLRMKDAEFIVPTILHNLKTGDHFAGLAQNDLRYAAGNFAALLKFGSFEFRFMRGMHTVQDLEFWAINLHKLVESSANAANPVTVLDWFQNSRPIDFLSMLFTPEFVQMIQVMVPNFEYYMKENFDYAFMLVREYSKPSYHKRFIGATEDTHVEKKIDKGNDIKFGVFNTTTYPVNLDAPRRRRLRENRIIGEPAIRALRDIFNDGEEADIQPQAVPAARPDEHFAPFPPDQPVDNLEEFRWEENVIIDDEDQGPF